MMLTCDKCGLPVRAREDATILDAIRMDCPGHILIARPRHIRCSPSRAQYITDPAFEPVVDERPEYDKRLLSPAVVAFREAEYTAAWKELQQHDDIDD